MDAGIILLAAGASSRMGQSKQLMKIRHKTLLVQSIETALQVTPQVVVVLGAYEQEHRKAMATGSVEIVFNREWNKGMGGSIKAGLKNIMERIPTLDTVIIMVCDQPLVTAEHLSELKDTHLKSGKRIVASRYSGTTGVPVLFHKTFFTEIMNLANGEGAKKIIQLHPGETNAIDFPDGSIDIDTPEDFRNFNGMS